MDLDRLHQILRETTQEFRKGEEIVESDAGRFHATEIFTMPHESEATANLQQVDCHFITVGVDPVKAEEYREELIQLLAEYPNPERLAGGPSYIEMGAVLGSQDTALRLFALGETLGLWNTITPKKLGIEGAMAEQLAGSGLVMIEGYSPGG